MKDSTQTKSDADTSSVDTIQIQQQSSLKDGSVVALEHGSPQPAQKRTPTSESRLSECKPAHDATLPTVPPPTLTGHYESLAGSSQEESNTSHAQGTLM
jgi:hypothetical protein